jgi:outer membrane autotransporter protein
LALAFGAIAIHVNAFGQTTVFTDTNTFANAIGSTSYYTLPLTAPSGSAQNVTNPYTIGNATYTGQSSITLYNDGFFGSNVYYLASGNASNNFLNVTLGGVTYKAVIFNFGYYSGGSGSITVSVNGGPAQTVLVNGASAGTGTTTFIGLISSQNITSIALANVAGNNSWEMDILIPSTGIIYIPPAATNVYNAAVALKNNPAYGAAKVIDANSNLSSLFSGLSGNNNISNSASQTLPLLTGSSVNAAKDVMRDISRIVQARLASNSGMSTGDSFDGNKNVWMKPFGSMADQNDINGVSGYKANTYGLAFGADAAVTKALRIGGAFAYAKSDINGESSIAPQSAQVDMYNLLAYGSYSLDDRTEINFQAGIGQNDNRGRRQIALTSSLATSNYNSDTANFGVGIGRTYKLSSETTLTPSVRVDYTWIKDQGYLESGAGLLNLNVNGRTTDALILGVDGKLSHQLNDRVSLIANLGIGYDTINKQASITSAFAGAPGAAFVTYGIDPSPWLTHAGVGAVYTTKSGLEIGARYDAEFRESFLNQTASIKARWSF